MKKMKLLTFALAALFAGNAMAAETVFQWGDMNQNTQPAPIKGALETTYSYNSIKINTNKTTVYGIKADGSMINSGVATKYIKISVEGGFLAGDTLIYTHAYNNSSDKVTTIIVANPNSEVVYRGTQTNNTRNVNDPTIDTCVLAADAEFLYLGREGKTSTFVLGITVIRPEQPKNIATLKAITIDGEALEGFSAATKEYNVELPFGTTEVPAVLATTTSAKANVVVTPAAALPGATTILVTAEDGETKETYTINFTVAASASDDATLAALMVDGKAIAGFRADSLDYAYEAAYSKNMPVVTATANDENAVVAITQITAFPGTATILVTAQAGNTLTYKIAFTQATAPKVLLEAVFSNGAKGAIKDAVISVPYLQGKEIPTIVSFKTADSTMTAAEIEGGIRVTGADNTTLDYSIRTVELAPLAFTTDVITFDSTETYIFDPYGFASDKGWKFAKNVEEASNRRVSEGRTRIYFALPAAKEVRLTSGTGGARAIKVYVNGIENTTVTKTAAKNEFITIALNATSDNLVAIESDQTGGDGGFIQLQLVSNADTALENAAEAIVVEKTIIDGQLVIIKNGLMYNAQGIRLN